MWDAVRVDVLTIGPLRVRREVKAPESATDSSLVVVLMHGFGAPGDDLVSLAGGVGAPAGTTFLFPEAPSALSDLMPLPYDVGDARAWWAIDVGRFERAMRAGTLEDLVKHVPDGLARVRDAVCAMLDSLERDHGIASSRVVLGGFSQGSMLATDVVLHSPRPFAGLVVLSGTLIAAEEWVPRMAARKGLHVFQSHGTEDPLLPFSIAERLRRSFDDAGLEVAFTRFEGGHGIPPSVLRDLGLWLTSRR